MVVEVRRVRADEGPALRAVRLEALREAPGAFLTTHAEALAITIDEWHERARRSSTGDHQVAFVADDDDGGGPLAGLVGAFVRGGTGGVELYGLWVAPRARRLAVGRRLVEAVVGWATDVGATDVQLWVTRGNEGARRLYEACGFVDLADPEVAPDDPCRDEHCMVRRLDARRGAAPAG